MLVLTKKPGVQMKAKPSAMRKVPPEDILEIERAMLAKARKAVFESTLWMTQQDMDGFLGRSMEETAALLEQWKRERAIFSVEIEGVEVYPRYAFTSDQPALPRKEFKPLIEVLLSDRSGFGIAMWLISVNGYLGGITPLEAIEKKSTKLLAAAEIDIAGILHG